MRVFGLFAIAALCILTLALPASACNYGAVPFGVGAGTCGVGVGACGGVGFPAPAANYYSYQQGFATGGCGGCGGVGLPATGGCGGVGVPLGGVGYYREGVGATYGLGACGGGVGVPFGAGGYGGYRGGFFPHRAFVGFPIGGHHGHHGGVHVGGRRGVHAWW